MNRSILKNPSPQQLAFGSALSLSFVLGGFMLLLSFFGKTHIPWYFIAACFACSFVTAYYFIYSALEIFIYRKIKLIYKSISSRKLSNKNSKFLEENDTLSLEQAAQDAQNWATHKEAEITRLQQLEAYRKAFLGDVSHELKTPIFNVQGYVHTLLDGGLEDAKINRDYLLRVDKNLDRIISMVNDLETISLLEIGELPMQYSRFGIYTLCKEVIEMMAYKADSNMISLRFKKGCENNFMVYADRERVKQVLINLIDNAIKYHKQEEKSNIQLGLYDMGGNIMIEVSDNGIGIEAKHLPHLFDRFFRVDKSRSRMAGGTGLGLAIVKHIIEAHGQQIHVRSTLAVGTTFSFTLEKG
ncbi:MAG: HAMP domain-containing sensor histidine kinase [Chitinophagales bacterium]|nr:GHKL domain-containing protein [Bacteroidota bacterium]